MAPFKQSEGLVLVAQFQDDLRVLAQDQSDFHVVLPEGRQTQIKRPLQDARRLFIFTERREAPPQLPPRAAARRVLRPQSSFDRREGPAVERQRLRRPIGGSQELREARHGLARLQMVLA